jgi:hypothetical protein
MTPEANASNYMLAWVASLSMTVDGVVWVTEPRLIHPSLNVNRPRGGVKRSEAKANNQFSLTPVVDLRSEAGLRSFARASYPGSLKPGAFAAAR